MKPTHPSEYIHRVKSWQMELHSLQCLCTNFWLQSQDRRKSACRQCLGTALLIKISSRWLNSFPKQAILFWFHKDLSTGNRTEGSPCNHIPRSPCIRLLSALQAERKVAGPTQPLCIGSQLKGRDSDLPSHQVVIQFCKRKTSPSETACF